jgi:hypothetical protein
MNMGTAVGWAGLVTGTVLGFVVPQIIVARKAKDPQNSNAALRGSTLAVSVGIIGLLYIFMVGEWKASPAF